MNSRDKFLLGELKKRRAEVAEALKEIPKDRRERVLRRLDEAIENVKQGRAPEWTKRESA